MAWPFRKQISDSRLIAAIQGGEGEVDHYLEYLYDRNRSTVTRYVRSNGGDGQEADEILHAGVVRVFEQIADGKFRRESKVSSYLVQVCKNLWIDQQKRAGQRLRADVAAAASLPVPEDDPLAFMEKRDLAERVRELLQVVDDRCRKLLIWSDGEGRPMKWIAAELGYSLQAAMNKKTKCRKAMREKVRKNGRYKGLIDELMAIE